MSILGRLACSAGMHDWEKETVIHDPGTGLAVPFTMENWDRIAKEYFCPGPLSPTLGLRCSRPRCRVVHWRPMY